MRERLRSAVVSGELQGKLPGERTLARRFHVNAKTLSKALTDLAAEGLLDRSVIKGLAHITGGGLTDNIPRILPEGTAVKIEKGSWPVLPIFELFRQIGNVSEFEM